MTKFCLFIITNFIFFNIHAQFLDNFSDGDYTNSPVWQAASSDFIINDQFQLQSYNTVANATYQITTALTLTSEAQWEFWVRLDFNTSSANYVDVWLTSTLQNLSDNNNTGYFIRLGSTDDNISLYKKNGSGNAEKIIEGEKGVLNSSSSKLKIRVIRTSSDKWILLRDMSGEGTSWRSEGETTDGSLTTSSYFGIFIRQSTASFFGKHFFDDFEVKEIENFPSQLNIKTVKATNARSVQITFDNPLNIASAEDVMHYHVNGMGNPVSATVDAINGSIVHLNFSEEFKTDIKNSLIVDEVTDVFGNKISEKMLDFYFYKAKRYDVVIDEVFADPSPQIGLPAQKFIELKNVTGFSINLMNWQLRDGNNTATLPSVELLPDSFLIITTATGLDAYKPFGQTVSVTGFPSLNISGSSIALYDNTGSVIHAMKYDLSSYQNEVKKDGGFTLEMINTGYGCTVAENWIASNDPSGGTPGKINSVNNKEIPSTSINIQNAYLLSSDTLMVQFNKPVDSAQAARKENYSLTEGASIQSIECLTPFLDEIKIILSTQVTEGKVYTITASGLTDCAGAQVGNKNSFHFGIPELPVVGDIVINEVLSDPKTTGAEYVELYNNSQKIFDISRLIIANRNSAGEPSSLTRIITTPVLFLPGNFLLLTKDATSTIREYPFTDASVIQKMNTLPSFPNDKGYVLIMDYQGNILDEINYEKNWHFALIKDKKGVSLERINYNGPSDKTNFHSASKDVNFGTPGIKNSQSRDEDNPGGPFTISPEVFSPDNDGIDDFLTIQYVFNNPGYVTNIKIFDGSGRMVRYLEKNSISGLKGFYRWDGLDDKNQKLPQGVYVIYFESFNENGRKVIHKKTVVLARRF